MSKLDSLYNGKDVIVTARAQEHMEREGGCKPSLFDQALLGPSLTCQLRGLRVDHGRMVEARERLDWKVREVQADFSKATKQEWKWGRSSKPSPQQLAKLLYDGFKVRVRLNDKENWTVAKNILVDIQNDQKTPEDALPAVDLALELSSLEEDRKALEKPLSPDGRMHSSFMVASAISGRWGSRKDCFGDGMNLHSASDLIRNIFIADPGYVMVSSDQMQAESNCVGHLAGSQWYIDAHAAGNVHVQSGRVFFPEHGEAVTKAWAKTTPWTYNKDKNFYDIMKMLQHANNYMQSAAGISRHLRVPKRESVKLQERYFARVPEIRAYHQWVANEILTKRRLVSPIGRVRQFLGRVWETTTIREAVSWQPQSCISDLTKIYLYRLWRDLDPCCLHVLMEQHDSVLYQVPESRLTDVLAQAAPLCDIPVPIGPRVMRIGWETKVGGSWGEMEEIKETKS